MKTNTPKCCYCGYELDDDELWYPTDEIGDIGKGDGDESKIVCPNLDCGMTFGVRCVHEIKFLQIDADGDEI